MYGADLKFSFQCYCSRGQRWPIIQRYGREELNFANPERLLSIRGVDSKRVQSENVATRKGFLRER